MKTFCIFFLRAALAFFLLLVCTFAFVPMLFLTFLGVAVLVAKSTLTIIPVPALKVSKAASARPGAAWPVASNA